MNWNWNTQILVAETFVPELQSCNVLCPPDSIEGVNHLKKGVKSLNSRGGNLQKQAMKPPAMADRENCPGSYWFSVTLKSRLNECRYFFT
ncbi:hypothetical protein SAMN05660909_00185 [Chitinophaga terrae (ex Kim and Jung 2007)]|uniref:Uncharacterized protein n=1 Tax=Chitinophaga terrae (ex Kim and Jung 2007) TaxID=408074 RepID=A0A1H3X1Y6_9BACT|nr:hypothetical protein [Chitinophaga terrae (ex Kim and Jung 2007)]SDZ92642.1 hypothetical protein SAMN05660909_00185 [Chitinophaga terrae (ex Kim and Jung 2007)]